MMNHFYNNRRYVLLVFLFINVVLHMATYAQPRDQTAIKQVLAKQAAAWNSGNIDAYMKGYWQSNNLLFIGKSGPRYGYASTLANYKKVILTLLLWVSYVSIPCN